MKFCQSCGSELFDEAVICPKCGCAVAENKSTSSKKGDDGLALAVKVFLILGCIAQGWLILPLAWCLPITISICKKMNKGEPVGIGLKIWALLFVNTIGGILSICRSDD